MKDIDPIETQEWLDALATIVTEEGTERSQFILQTLLNEAPKVGVDVVSDGATAYLNTISTADEVPYPGDLALEEKITAIHRWNAMAMVVRAGRKASELGGHIATYASAASLYEVGFHHFFRARNDKQLDDLLLIQGHSSPGIYARGLLEGRFSTEQLENFRQEVEVDGLSSYPHPWLMPDYWQFATVSMGLGMMQGLYTARFIKYLENRKLLKVSDRKLWIFCGDGEMDEPESLGAIGLAGRENLDNLIVVINCNLQRLDGPVRGNGKIIQELERFFRGAGWNVVKSLWGSRWDPLLAKDTQGFLAKRMSECVDGEYQAFTAHGGAYLREHFFGKYHELQTMVADMSDEDLEAFEFAGHDPKRVYNAYLAASHHKGQPTLILMKSVKGYGMGAAGEAQNIAHNKKKMNTDELHLIRDRFNIPVTDEQIENVDFCIPDKNSEEVKYILEKRKALGGFTPSRTHTSSTQLTIPSLDIFAKQLEDSGDREISTTMVFVRLLACLLKDKNIKKHIVPIVADESRTFGMEGLFRQVGIYTPSEQLYDPMDSAQVMYYHEAVDGQILEEGITEAGAFSSWLAAATSYAVNDVPMIPFYIYYSMFGFQRIGDFAWAAGDMQARGFLLGATAGRTTLAGEGLQHQDGHSHVLASTIPNCVSYDPTFGYELAVIMQDGLRRMYQENESVFFYITVLNENYHHPAMPKGLDEGILKGIYLLKSAAKGKHPVQLLGSGSILREVIAAAEILEKDYDVAANVWSVTSFNELRRDGLAKARHNLRNPEAKPQQTYVEECLAEQKGPVIAATDYMRIHADQIRPYLWQSYTVLGTDGFGRSDTRKQLRHFFEVDAKAIVCATLNSLLTSGDIKVDVLTNAMKALGVDRNKPNPVSE